MPTTRARRGAGSWPRRSPRRCAGWPPASATSCPKGLATLPPGVADRRRGSADCPVEPRACGEGGGRAGHGLAARAVGERRSRVAVVVGGTSIRWGNGQRAGEVWTRHLRDRLGDGYRVLNLAMSGAFPAEFGGTAADVLTSDRPRLIYVSYVSLNLLGPSPPL